MHIFRTLTAQQEGSIRINCIHIRGYFLSFHRIFEQEVSYVSVPVHDQFTANGTNLHDESINRPPSMSRLQLKVSRTVLGRSQLYATLYTDALYYLLSFILPLIVLCFMNFCVIRAYRAAQRRRRRMSNRHKQQQHHKARATVLGGGNSRNTPSTTASSSPQQPQPTGRDRAGSKACCRKPDHESSVTLVMIVIVVVFVACQAPARIVQAFLGYSYNGCQVENFMFLHLYMDEISLNDCGLMFLYLSNPATGTNIRQYTSSGTYCLSVKIHSEPKKIEPHFSTITFSFIYRFLTP